MEFWGVEVRAGEPLLVKPETGMVIHLSQACLGETKSKGTEPILLSVKVDDKKFVLGTLSLEKIPQLTFDLVFEKDFKLSHNWKHGSIYLCGYQTSVGDHCVATEDEFDDFDDDSEEEEDIPPNAIQNGKGGQKVEPAKPDAKTNAAKPESSEKPKVKVVEPSKDEEDDTEDSDESDEDDSDDEMVSSGDDSDKDVLGGDSDDDDNDEEDSDEEDGEETPKKPEPNKKRTNDSAVKTPVPAKKPKAGASPKSDGKKGGHTATPHPAKNAGKTPGTGDKSKGPETLKSASKSGAQISCKSCSKTFSSDKALESHTKAKHG